jgi:GntR family transcriptional regulator, rspAB operon transcriptional repressor
VVEGDPPVTLESHLSEGLAVPLQLPGRPESLTAVVYDAIRQAIVEKRLAPGSRVTEASLAEQLGVSKTPVREALLRLREVGVIEPHGRRGGRIVRPSQASIRDAYEVREALESYAAGSAAQRVTPEQIERLRAVAERSLERAHRNDLAGFLEADVAFHGGIAAAAGNPALERMIDGAVTLALTLRRRDRPHATASVACAEAHVRIATAIADRDPAGARREMESHIGFLLTVVAADAEHGHADEVAV